MTSTTHEWRPDVAAHDGPKYLAVLHALERDIQSGALMPGDRLPPQRQVADLFGVTISTITKAFAEATRRGLVNATPGSGTFVAAKPSEFQGANPFVEMGINLIPHALCEDQLKSCLRDYVERTSASDMLRYAGYRLLPASPGRRFAEWLIAQGFPLDDGAILTCNGTQQGLVAAFQCLAAPGETVLCEALTYSGILRIIDQLGLAAHGIAMDGEGMRPDALERALVETGARLVVVTPTAQNPTGATMSDDRRRAIAACVEKHDAFLIEDAVAAPLTGIDRPSIASFAPQRCVYLTGASKCLAPGVRFGLLRVPEVLVSTIEQGLTATNWTGPAYFAGFADIVVESGAVDRIVSLYRTDAAARQELARRHLGGVPASTIAYHYWVDLPAAMSAASLVAEAAGANMHLTPATPFSCPNVVAPNALRVCLGAETRIDSLEGGLKRLAHLLTKSRPPAVPVI